MGGELAEERGAAALATERADAEAAERLRVERDNRDLVANNQRLQQVSFAPTKKSYAIFVSLCWFQCIFSCINICNTQYLFPMVKY